MGLTEWVIISGKGGTGKTSVTAALSTSCGSSVLTDTDVDGANLELVLQAEKVSESRFEGRRKAVINPSLCQACGRCADECRFDAVHPLASRADRGILMRVESDACEGCGLCKRVCPADAISMKKTLGGTWRHSVTPYGHLFHARLEPGGENSGKLVALLRKQAREFAETHGIGLMLTDGPPGSGCPVIATLTGASQVLVVTEPTPSGRSDAERVVDLCRHFRRPVSLAINKFDLHPRIASEVEAWAVEKELAIVGRLPYDPVVPTAIRKGVPVTTLPASRWGEALGEMANRMGFLRGSSPKKLDSRRD